MKALIASDPAGVLGEPGLELVRVEYPFPTGDRIDVVLRDSAGRYVAVEIEPDCKADEVAGPLQCMKYRALLAYTLERPVDEVRSILFSRSIHGDVRLRCDRYAIEPRVLLCVAGSPSA
jgi:RecB family endonuclease NucS